MEISAIEVGKTFRYGGIEWVLLDRRADRNFFLSLRELACVAFDRAGRSYYPASSLYGWLNGSLIEKMAENGAQNVRSELTPVTLDCIDPRERATIIALVGLLSFRQARAYQELIPPIDRWWWTCTPCDGHLGRGLRCLCGKWTGSYGYYQPIDRTPAVRPTISLMGSALVQKGIEERR